MNFLDLLWIKIFFQDRRELDFGNFENPFE